jgi:hypothetical protein
MRLSSILFILYLLFNGLSSTHAQMFSWREPSKLTCFKIDFFTNRLYQSNQQGEWLDVGGVNYQDIIKADLFSSEEGINAVKIQGKLETYLIMECSGQVYSFNQTTRTLKREDLTFFRGANCKSVQFSRKGVLLSFGGYGFWQSTNVITQFNLVSKDWTHMLVSGSIPSAINDHSAVYLPETDQFVVVGTHRVNQTESAEVLDLDYGIYNFQFPEKKFVKLGEVYEPILKKIISGHQKNFILSMGPYIIISPYEAISGYNHDLLYIIDTKNSYKGYLWTNPARFQIRRHMDDRGILYRVYTRGLSVFLPQLQETYPYGSYQIAEVPIKTLLAESKPLGNIMDKPVLDRAQDFVLLILGVFAVIFVLRFFISLKRRNKRKQLSMLLSPNEKQFLDFLRLNYRQGHVTGHQIVAFFGKHKSSPESQRQFRAKLIEGLTKALGLVFPGEQVLDIQADEKDLRMLTYRLTEPIYREIKKL